MGADKERTLLKTVFIDDEWFKKVDRWPDYKVKAVLVRLQKQNVFDKRSTK